MHLASGPFSDARTVARTHEEEMSAHRLDIMRVRVSWSAFESACACAGGGGEGTVVIATTAVHDDVDGDGDGDTIAMIN